MDVTSLLNQSAAASEDCKISTRVSTPSSCILTQEKLSSASLPTPSPDRTTPQQDSDSKPSKNRKPWSAGGYALPSRNDLKYRSSSIFSFRSASENLDSEGSYETTAMERHSRMGSVESTSMDLELSQPSLPQTRTLQNRQNYWDDSETPDSIGHKISDSRSSLSSFASWRSRSHSRISSVTTLSGIHSTRQSVADFPMLETTLPSCSESYRTLSSAKRTQQSTIIRPLPPYQIDEMTAPKRCGSPSDAVLNMNNSNKPQTVDAPNSCSTDRPSHSVASPRSHKRATSAPDFCPAANYKLSRQPRAVLVAPSEVMPVSEDENTQSVARNDVSNGLSHHAGGYSEFEGAREIPEHQSEGISALRPKRTPPSPTVTAGSLNYSTRLTKPSSNNTALLNEDDEEKPVCMFVDDCDTGSQLRKAISHLFGRNKTCTLKIPKMVWVYYCRKHYQRVRYRNARTYPVTQMELVETQIERLKAWSDQNQARGKGAYIKSWTLSLRKREEKRLKGNSGANEEEEDASALGGTHIPAWIIGELGDGFDTAHMFAIAARLREDIESGTLNQVPEIEFLPDIVDDESEKDAGKPARYRRQTGTISAAKQPKRKASDFSVLNRQSAVYWDMGYQTHHPADEGIIVTAPGKRPCTTRAATFPHHQSSDSHGAYMAQPLQPFMASSYGFGAQGPTGHPPRAQNIVPKMQPLEYTRHAYATMGGHDHQGYGGAHGHARVSSYQGPQGGSHALDAHNHHDAPPASGGYGQHYTIRRGDPTSPPTLPSIATQMQSDGIGPVQDRLQSSLSVAGMRPQSRGTWRPLHQRSASAFTPGSKFVSASGRLSMTGNGASTEHARRDEDHYRPSQPPTSFDPTRHAPPVYGRHEWTPEYSHVPQCPYQQDGCGSDYVPPPKGMDASRQAASTTRHSDTPVYPEPAVPLNCRFT